MDMKQISIDVDVSRVVENARASFAESENEILRRLLGLPSGSERSTSEFQPGTTDGWHGTHQKTGREVFLPNGTELKADYNGATLFAEIKNKMILVHGKYYRSVSPALHQNVEKKDGGHPSLNGWIYWKAKRPGESRFSPILPV